MRKIKITDIPKSEHRKATTKYNSLIEEIKQLTQKDALEINSQVDFNVKMVTLMSYLKSSKEKILKNIQIRQRKGLIYVNLTQQ